MRRTAFKDVHMHDPLAGVDPPVTGRDGITVLIAEDDPFIRDILSAVIGDGGGFRIVATAGDADAAIDAAIEHSPVLALLDVRMPGGGGARAAKVIAETCPEVHIVAISSHDDQETIGEMVSAGARGYITKDAPRDQMLETLRRCAAGELIFTPASANSLMREYAKSSQRLAEAKKRRRLREQRLREICEPRAIHSVFQPIVALDTGRVDMYEALTRFESPHGLNTGEWFEEAVELGMSVELELAVLARTVAELAGAGAGMAAEPADDGLHVSLNASPEMLLNPALHATLSAIDPRRIVIEVTEHAQISDYAEIKRAIARLRSHGMRLAIDDAGAGFASLRHILDLAPDMIKLDLSLVRGIDTDQPRRALATGLISFAREIDAEIVAEGIETQGELECVRELGVQYGQGYFIARPAPLAELLVRHIELSG
ncbi:MAG: EAL domain-containing protein [Actinobacteria bacterium]|nr:EAL domain-containing protein [Actinomycetota bacterium]